MDSENRPVKKSSSGKPAATNKDVVKVAPAVARQLEIQAAKLKMHKSTYASAAISYFAQNGLDPTQVTGPSESQLTRSLLGESIQQGREEHIKIGNSLLRVMRAWEKESYKFLQAQQASNFAYLEKIEANILRHQEDVEGKVLSTILDHVMRAKVEGNTTRTLAEDILVTLWAVHKEELTNKDGYIQREKGELMNKNNYAQRDRLARQLQQAMEKIAAPVPIVTPREVTPEIPKTALKISQSNTDTSSPE